MSRTKDCLLIYAKFCLFLFITVDVLGIAIPWLLSQKNDLAVFVGVILGVLYIPGAVLIAIDIWVSIHGLKIKEYTKNEKDSTDTSNAGNTECL